jgi:hypothetical protein
MARYNFFDLIVKVVTAMWAYIQSLQPGATPVPVSAPVSRPSMPVQIPVSAPVLRPTASVPVTAPQAPVKQGKRN